MELVCVCVSASINAWLALEEELVRFGCSVCHGLQLNILAARRACDRDVTCVRALLSMRELWKYELVNFKCGAVLVVVKREDPQKALKWPTKSVATLFLPCSIPVFPLFSGSRFFPFQTIFTDQLIYLLNPPPRFSSPISTAIFPSYFVINGGSVPWQRSKTQRKRRRTREKAEDAEKPCERKIIRKENEKKAGLWSGWTTKITPETPDFIDFSLELHAFWWSLWKWDPDPNERGTGNERRWSRGRTEK